MSKQSVCLSAANKAISERRTEAADRTAEKREKIFTDCPEARELTGKMEACMSRIFRSFNEKEKDAALFDQCREEVNGYRKQRQEFLEKKGYSEKDLEPFYFCPVCKDQGVIGTELCSCYKRELSKQYLKISNLSPDPSKTSFKAFNCDYYGENAPKMKKCLEYCKQYVKSFACGNSAEKVSENILMYGAPGAGKTLLSCAVGFSLIEKGHFVLYTPVQEMISTFEDAQFNHNSEADTDVYTEAELLIIDDLGAEFKSPFADNVLYNVINTRLNRHLPFIISTNFSADELGERYHERITSRIFYETVHFPFPAVDIRIEKRKMKKN